MALVIYVSILILSQFLEVRKTKLTKKAVNIQKIIITKLQMGICAKMYCFGYYTLKKNYRISH